MTPAVPLFTVYAPGGAVWSHPHLRRFAAWLRVHGWRGRLPRWAVRECRAMWPAQRCRCGSYHIIWKEQAYASEKDEE